MKNQLLKPQNVRNTKMIEKYSTPILNQKKEIRNYNRKEIAKSNLNVKLSPLSKNEFAEILTMYKNKFSK